jgi:hypothetical protein
LTLSIVSYRNIEATSREVAKGNLHMRFYEAFTILPSLKAEALVRLRAFASLPTLLVDKFYEVLFMRKSK